jgi:tetratricopeptide (TPR) repeat protein
MDGANRIALNNLAYLLAKEDPDAALSYAKKAAELAPDDPAVLDTVGWVYYRKGFYRQALSNLQNAVVKGDTPLRRYHMAYFKLGNSEEGQRALDAALLADPNLPKKEGNWSELRSRGRPIADPTRVRGPRRRCRRVGRRFPQVVIEGREREAGANRQLQVRGVGGRQAILLSQPENGRQLRGGGHTSCYREHRRLQRISPGIGSPEGTR